jgi:ubiquinone/menaquinone biosynthesis C-methylase UbiE
MRAMKPALEPELMDRADIEPRVNERALADLDRVTGWLFGLGPLRRAILSRLRPGMRVLDVGAGSGLATCDLVRRGPGVAAVALDRRLRHLLWGRSLRPAVARVVADARALPFRPGAFDWSVSSLFFHHFDGEENRAIVAEMRRVARRGVVVSDLRRTVTGSWLLRLFFPFFGVGYVARHDGLVSLARAWSLAEVREWLGEASRYELRGRFPVRFTLVLED